MLPWLTANDSSSCLHVLVYSSKCARAVLCFLCCDWRSRAQDWTREIQEGGSSQGSPVRSGGPSASCGKSEVRPAWNTRLEFSSHLIPLSWVVGPILSVSSYFGLSWLNFDLISARRSSICHLFGWLASVDLNSARGDWAPNDGVKASLFSNLLKQLMEKYERCRRALMLALKVFSFIGKYRHDFLRVVKLQHKSINVGRAKKTSLIPPPHMHWCQSPTGTVMSQYSYSKQTSGPDSIWRF